MDNVTEDKISKGGILLKFYFDIKNKDKEKLQPLLVDLVNEHLLKENGVVYCYGAIEEPIEMDGLYSTSGTVTVLFESLRYAAVVVFRYAPAGIELIRPTKGINLKPSDMQGLLMDLSLISNDYSAYILQNVLTVEQREQLSKSIEDRIEHGKTMMDNNKSESEKK